LVSSTDPDARVTRKYGQTILGYKDHRVVDDRSGVITATVTTDAGTADSHVLDEALDQHEHNTGIAPRTVVADKGYGTAEVYESMAHRQITPCIPHQKHNGVGIYGPGHFRYDAPRDAYQCPQGQWLHRYCTTGDGSGRYRAAQGVCAVCACQSQCTKAKDGRRLTRYIGQKWIDWADGCYSREHRRRLLRRRMYRSEGSFADAANNHGYKRARWRGLIGMTIQNLLVAAAQNLRKLLRARRRKPAGALRAGKIACLEHGFGCWNHLWPSITCRKALVEPCMTC
jgi:IS5 family transposase